MRYSMAQVVWAAEQLTVPEKQDLNFLDLEEADRRYASGQLGSKEILNFLRRAADKGRNYS